MEERKDGPERLAGGIEEVRKAWDALPEPSRAALRKTLNSLPGDWKGLRGLMDQALEHYRLAAGRKHRIVIVGPVNTGKSTLYNQLLGSGEEAALVSPVPGSTRHVKEAEAGLFTVVDTPGADAIGAVGAEEKEKALSAARAADVLVILFDATHGIRHGERDLFLELTRLEIPSVVGLNKMDLISRGDQPSVIGAAAAALGVSSEAVIPLSAKGGTGVERILTEIVRTEPEIVAALGAALPAHRWRLSQVVIGRAATTSAAIAVTPLPLLDFLPLLGLQAAMVLGIARIYRYEITLGRARELVATFGLGLLGRTLFHEVSKLGGPPGWLVAAAVAAGTTTAVGYGAAAWFERGERLPTDTLKRISRAVSETILERLKDLGRRRPGRITLRERISEALEDLPEPEGTPEAS